MDGPVEVKPVDGDMLDLFVYSFMDGDIREMFLYNLWNEGCEDAPDLDFGAREHGFVIFDSPKDII